MDGGDERGETMREWYKWVVANECGGWLIDIRLEVG